MTKDTFYICHYDFHDTYIKGQFIRETPEFVVLKNAMCRYAGVQQIKNIESANGECFVNKNLIKYMTVEK